MKTKIGSQFITATLLLNLSGCSYVKTLFPDKEKDYQYTTEIPPLILPDDLKKNRIPGLTSTDQATPPLSTDAGTAAPPAAVNAPLEETASAAPTAKESAITKPEDTASAESETVIPDNAIKVERIKVNDDENRLRINIPSDRAWHIVGKALSRKTIEVTERNHEGRLFTVLYDPYEAKPKGNSYWEDITFFFHGIQSNEKKYVLKLDENNRQTDIIIVDENRKPLSDAGSTKLLTLLEETIKADLAKK